MPSTLMIGNHWLEPLMPAFPSELLKLAEEIHFQAGKLTGMVSPEMTSRVSGLLRVTSSFYSNLIEGKFAHCTSF
ncbi:hypothetical protein CCU68_26310 [Pseudomonas gingeri NCPPB 3146 = LMG 5327]|uniref:Uncharacterized protein n=2 Tax=Pseudomonas gingeri TaxID=117681 RepID=A0A7Y8CGM1_9PSED|nr:hypothetical protein [Pseudomonas gingeri]NWC17472.1 hypothetical protein [Pseudomonas gingeri]PNQ89591.1 hypothetical protein CCU68_26310 [Pseudomonas gingeri NCPPB 3146 = LMG 5327]